jgi:hypothetical protein
MFPIGAADSVALRARGRDKSGSMVFTLSESMAAFKSMLDE